MAGIVDEMIVVDTGSTDNTRELAAKMGAKVIQNPWCDDFSSARNAGLEQVTSDYVLWMDADEYFNHEARVALLVFKNILPLKKKVGILFEVKTFNHEEDLEKNYTGSKNGYGRIFNFKK